jgi:tripartite-type tricarboxylate transporter receptor subunit TctC
MNPQHLASRLLLAAACVLSLTAQAQNYPARPVRMIVPFPPGGISDTLARVTAQQFSEVMSQQFVVDNRPGAGTTLAADLIAKSQPDGYTLYFTDVTTHAINATLYARPPFDSVRDFRRLPSRPNLPWCWWSIRRCR